MTHSTPPRCVCPRIERLEGAATQAYTTQFLERAGAESYCCRECGAMWRRVSEEDQKRPSLVRVTEQE